MLSRSQLSLAAHVLPTLHSDSVRVALAGRDALARAALRATLGGYDDLLVEELDTDDRLLSRVRVLAPDLVVADAVPHVLELLPRIESPVLLVLHDPRVAHDALAAGARGIILRDASPRRVHAAVRAVSEGLTVVDEELSGAIPHRRDSGSNVVALSRAIATHPRGDAELVEPLTHREGEVMQLLADGLTNKEIASRLGISDHTVKFHVNGILGKLGVETRTEAVVHAARLGIVVL